jgi:proteasome lid subunit RPN8/RPN11
MTVHIEQASSVQDDLASLSVQKPPLDEQTLAHGRVQTDTSRANQVQVIMHQEALAQVESHGNSNTYAELGGVLLGHAYQHEGVVYVEALAAIPARSTEHGPVHFTFTAEAWSQLHLERETHYPDLHIVGWFHTHPNLTVFYSADDVVVHSVAFSMPWHVGLVVDPVRRESAFFGWTSNDNLPEGREILPLPGFYELPTTQPSKVVDWRYKFRRSLDKMLESAYGSTLYQQAYSGAASLQAEEWWRNPSLNFGLATAALISLVLLIAFGMVPLYVRTQSANEAIQVLAAERMMMAESIGVASCPDPNAQIILPTAGSSQWQGAQLDVFGVADHPATGRYEIYAQPVGSDQTIAVATRRWRTELGSLATWDTTTLSPGVYNLVLQPTRSNGLPLTNATCIVQVTLVAQPSEPATP